MALLATLCLLAQSINLDPESGILTIKETSHRDSSDVHQLDKLYVALIVKNAQGEKLFEGRQKR